MDVIVARANFFSFFMDSTIGSFFVKVKFLPSMKEAIQFPFLINTPWTVSTSQSWKFLVQTHPEPAGYSSIIESASVHLYDTGILSLV
jgi:hypothetical protein